MDIANSYIEYMQFRLLVLYTAWMFDQQQEHGREGRQTISAVKAAMAKIAQDVVTRAVHLHGSIGLSNAMHFRQYLAVALHAGAADGVTGHPLATVCNQLLPGYMPANAHCPPQTPHERKVWAPEHP